MNAGLTNGDPARVLVLHNRYRQPGGEERSVEDLVELLRERSHEVGLLERRSADTGAARAGAAMLRGGLDPAEVGAAVREHGADIVHAHNTVPLFGPRALAAAREAGARVVLHLHNYRLHCAIGIAYRDGAPCTRCKGRATWHGAALRCRGGIAESAVYAAGLARQQPRMTRAVDRFIVPSEGALRLLEEFGMRTTRCDVIPHFLPRGSLARRSEAEAGEHALYAGRLAEEKGADTAIRATALAGVPLAIAGQGPDERRLRSIAAQTPGAEVRFLGRLDEEALGETRRKAAFALAPSRWHEPHPYAVAEAMAAGLPVLASAIGGLPELVGEQSTLPPDDPARWSQAVGELWRNPARRRERGEAALARARERFDPDRYYERLIACYSKVRG